jgi:lysophospholipase L1-like esterase
VSIAPSSAMALARTRVAPRCLAVLVLVLLAHPAGAVPRPAKACPLPSWVAAWTASPVQTVEGFSDRTYRSLVTVHYPGRQVRVRLTNALGTAPVHVDTVTVGRATSQAALEPGTVRQVRFGGRTGVTVPAGQELWSDPVSLAVQGMSRIAVSFYSSGSTGRLTGHSSEPQSAGSPPSDAIPLGLAMESHLSFLSLPGDHSRDEADTSFVQPDTSAALVNGVDVLPDRQTAAVVAFGDSITDGFGSTPNADATWPDQLSRRLLDANLPIAVVNAGISGGRVITPGGRGPSAVDRMARDVLAQSGVRAVIVLEGINDIGAFATAEQVIAGYQRLIQLAHSRGVRAIGGLLTPSGDLARPFPGRSYSTPEAVATRHRVNEWIVSSGTFDAVIDFESAVRDPLLPEHWRQGHSYDNLHGNDAGYALMAGAVSLPALTRATSCL